MNASSTHHARPFSRRTISLTSLALGMVASACGLTDGNERFSSVQSAALHQAASCDDLLSQIQADAIAKVRDQGAALRRYGMDGYGYTRGGGIAVDDAVGAPTAGAGAQSNSGSGDVAAPEAPASPDDYSETNTQVSGVDEADIIKTDGERIYLVHGNELYLLDSWPSDETRILGQTKVEGQVQELFVDGGRATVFSTVFDPVETPVSNGDEKSVPDIGAPDCFDCGDYYYGGHQFTKVSVFDVTGSVPVLERELLVEGSYVSARRHDDVVRTVVQGGYRSPGYYVDFDLYDYTTGQPLSQMELEVRTADWESRMVAKIRATTLDDWLPRRFERADGEWKALDRACQHHFTPEPGLVENGITQVITFDSEVREEPNVTAIVGGAQHVYANHDVMLIAQTDYQWEWGEGDATRTALHQFAIDGDQTPYEASGFVPGYIHDQFSLDERDGVIRVSTTEDVRRNSDDPWDTTSVNRVFTFARADGKLGSLGATGPMAPGETIFSTRFLGDRAYVVTFLQTDPLFVVDLSDPNELKVLGEAKIPGFSDYIHPLGPDHLLTIGQDGTDDGQTLGVALQIFDVSDPTKPTLTHKLPYGGFGYSEASHNHKAFTFDAARGLLLFPMVTYEPDYQSLLQVVHVDAADGFTQLGSVDHAPLLQQGCSDYELTFEPCYYYYGDEMRRGVLIEDFVYAVSQRGVTVHSLDDLASEVARVDLPEPDYSYSGGGVDGGVPTPAPVEPIPTEPAPDEPPTDGEMGMAGAPAN